MSKNTEKTPEIDARVLHIARLMADGRWRGGLSHAELARHWGVSMAYVANSACEAARFLRLSAGENREEIIGALLAELQSLTAIARTDRKVGDAVRALELRCRLLRVVDEPAKLQGPPAFGSAKDALAWIEGMLPELREAAAQEPAQLPAPTTTTIDAEVVDGELEPSDRV